MPDLARAAGSMASGDMSIKAGASAIMSVTHAGRVSSPGPVIAQWRI